MRRTIAAALTGIALLVGGSVAAILWLTDSSSAGGGHSSPPRTIEPSPAAGAWRPTTAAAAATVIPPPDEAAAPAPVEPTAPSLAPAAELDLRDAAPGLAAHVTRRCGRMRLEPLAPRADVAGSADAVLLLVLETLPGQARIVDSSVEAPGRTRPALVACAQWALRGQVVPAPGAAPGREVRVPVTLGPEARP